MHPVFRIVLLIILALVSSADTALSQQASASPAKPTPAPTPIPLAKVPLEAQSTLASLQEIEANVSKEVSSAEAMDGTLSELTNEIDARTGEDKRLLTSSPGLEVLYRLKVAWRNFGVRSSVSARELTQHATSVEEQLGRLDKLNKAWQATLLLAKQPETPPPVLQRVQSVVDSVERARQTAESGQANVLALQSRISEQEARIRTALSLIEQGENRALKSIFVRDSAPIWSLQTSLGTEWEQHSGESFSSQLKTSAAFAKRLPFAFLIHALFILLVATALHWMRRRVGKLAEEKPDLRRALPILDLPVSTAFALSILIIPLVYTQAPRLIQALVGTVILIPTVLILRRLLVRSAYPILNALVVLYFVSQFLVLAASLSVLARFIFLGQVLGAAVFLAWVVRSWHLPAEVVETHGLIWRTIRAIAKIGLFFCRWRS